MNRKSNASLATNSSLNSSDQKEKQNQFDVVSSNKHTDQLPQELEIVAKTLKILVINRLEASSDGDTNFDFNSSLDKKETEDVHSLLKTVSKNTISSLKEIATVVLSKALEEDFDKDELQEAIADGWLNILASHCVALIEGEKIKLSSNEEDSEKPTAPVKRGRKKTETVDFSEAQAKQTFKEVKPLSKTSKPQTRTKTSSERPIKLESKVRRASTREEEVVEEEPLRARAPKENRERDRERDGRRPNSYSSYSPSSQRRPSSQPRGSMHQRPSYGDQQRPSRGRYGMQSNSEGGYQNRAPRAEYGRTMGRPPSRRPLSDRMPSNRNSSGRMSTGYMPQRSSDMNQHDSRPPRRGPYSHYGRPNPNGRPSSTRRNDMGSPWHQDSSGYHRSKPGAPHLRPREESSESFNDKDPRTSAGKKRPSGRSKI